MTLLSLPRFLLFAFLLIGYAGAAQSGKAVYKYNDSLDTKINTYRMQVFDQLKRGEAKAVRLNYGFETYVSTVYQGSFSTSGIEKVRHYLDLDEIEGVYLLQQNFAGILDIIRNNGFVFENDKRTELVDPREAADPGIPWRSYNFGGDSLAAQVGTFLLREKQAVKDAIIASTYSQEEQDFLKVFVDYEVVYLWDIWRWQYPSPEAERAHFAEHERLDSIVKIEAVAFIKQYENSEFNDFITEFILREFEVKAWAVGLDPLYLGSLIPTGELSDYLKPAYFYAQLGFRVYYKNAFVNIMGGITSAGLRQDIFLDTIWTRGVTMLTGDVTLGYSFKITERFGISPLLGMRGILNTGPKNEGKRVRFSSQIPWTAGMEFTIGGISEPYNYICPNYFRGRFRQGIGLKVMYQNPGYAQVLPELSGGLWTVTLGFNLALFGVKD